ncbi:hypothetical protein LB505_008706 [Fusarium chuoi]|nr:hypothetical protein LB505_008706 [Fusarium chuoi]
MPPQSTSTPASDAAAPLTQAQILADAEITPDRPAKTTITEARGFSLLEKTSFSDLLQEYCDTRPPTGDDSLVFTAELQNSFFEKVFQYWDSDDELVVMPTLLQKKIQQTSARVGYFTQTLPVTPSKRKRGQNFQTNPHRMANADAYMNVSFEANSQGKEFKYCWKDEGGLTVSAEFVRYKDGYTKATAIEAAIVNWDKCERARVDRYNSELIIALARMRTVRFARDGTANAPAIPQELRINGRTLKCQLISDDFEEHADIVQAVRSGLKARKIGRRHHVII